jgi:hypothetical protein
MVEDPAGELKKVLENPDNPEREAAFQRLLAEEEENLEKFLRRKAPELEDRYGIHFSDERIKLITRRTAESQTDVDVAVEEIKSIHQAALDFALKFSNRNEVEISFTEGAIDSLVEKIWENGLEPLDYLQQAFQNYEHGLKLIKEKTGKRDFPVTAEGMENPEQYLNRLIQQTYR